jgi:LPS sulfotransferase NodH
MSEIAPFLLLLAEADFRKHVERAGPLDLIVDLDVAEAAAGAVAEHSLAPLIDVVGLLPDATDLPAALAPENADIRRPLWIFSPEHEERLLARLQGNVGRPVWGVYRDIYGPANAGPVIASHTIANREDIDAYAIACTARSGSTYVCELLSRNGGAKPKEHLRPPIVDMLATAPDGKRLENYIELIVRHGQKNGVFGTKLIQHFCKASAPFVDVASLHRELTSFRSFRIIYLVRNSKVLQAISTERALQTKIYHVRSNDNANGQVPAKANDDYVYDYEALRVRVEHLHREEQELQKFLQTLPYEVLTVEYEALVEDPESQMRRILDFLSLQRSQIVCDTRIIKIANEKADRIADQFREEHARRTGQPALKRLESTEDQISEMEETEHPGDRPL